MVTRLCIVAATLALLCACSSGASTESGQPEEVKDSRVLDVRAADQVVFPDLGPTEVTKDVPVFLDLTPVDTHVPGCEEGEGCFLDHCLENSDCLSGWCVQHLGEGVCTIPCQEECPDGWSCKMLGGLGPDPVYLCISDFGNLCKPCSQSEDCISESAGDDVCVDYGVEGSFCGGQCEEDQDCPWGFSCLTVDTVDGATLQQCVAEAGVCPCSSLSVALGLWTPCAQQSESGTCTGKRFCTEDGLTDCDAQEPGQEACNGIDDDCDGDVDEPQEVDGDYINLCNDENECTDDACTGTEGCAYTLLEEGECKDGDACTVGDHCEQGVCIGAPVECDDSNPCTVDSCDGLGGCQFEEVQTPCDDGDPCTVGDFCQAGSCNGTTVNCDCHSDADCLGLEDEDLCNGTLICDLEKLPYQCVVAPGTEISCPAPDGHHSLCLTAHCQPETGDCVEVSANDGLPCDDQDACTWGETCTAGQCSGGQPLNCNDGNPCTDDSCQQESGCVHLNNEAPCQDGDSCTVGDQCADGQCVPGQGMACDDGNPCTDDACVDANGCVHQENAAACDDGNPCTTGDHCAQGKCMFAGPAECVDENPCTTDSCDPGVGCVYALHEGPCDDNDLCTTGDHCHLGGCIHSGELACNDANPCTDDSCSPLTGCTFLPNQNPCDDGNACTDNDVCQNGQCAFGAAVACADQNPCTNDWCEPTQGCQFTPHTGPCDDGDICTLGDTCNNGQCWPGQDLLPCDDDNLCTTDACDPDSGCSFAPFDGECNDNDPCTDQDLCVNGWCQGEAKECDDDNPCTDNDCNADGQCIATANDAACNDDNVCTLVDQCSGMECQGSQQLDCDDSNPCTDDSCDPVAGCQYANNALPCPGGQCDNGECVPDISCIEYATGNDAYWFERKEGFRDVCIGGGATIYGYVAQYKQYQNGNTILLPNKVGSADGGTINSNGFYGFSGGSPSESAYHWDKVSNPQVPQPSVWDVTGMFVSPMSANEFHYCKTLNWNSPDCNNTIIDGPVETLAYPGFNPKNGTYNLNLSNEQINAGVLVGSQTTWISQQQMDATAHPSYCVATYGRGWRLPTDIEMGHTTDSHGWNAGIDPTYNASGGSYRLWSSSRYLPINDGHLFILWPLGTGQNGYWDGNGVAATNQNTRCVFPGVD